MRDGQLMTSILPKSNNNSLLDPFLVSQYHKEYLSLINFYDNHKRPSSFIRYYNIDYDESIYQNTIESTFDLYKISEIKFDIYDFTPTYVLAPIVSSTVNAPEKTGQKYDGVTSIVTYTINVPRINDIVVFYRPISAGEIYRVSNIRTPINAYHSNPKLTWYEMDLEIAPIKDTSKLKISKHYIYDISKEAYHTYSEYQVKMDIVKKLNYYSKHLQSFYNYYYDLYCIDDLVPIVPNLIINNLKNEIERKNNAEIRLFNELMKPYGFLTLLSKNISGFSENTEIDIDTNIYYLYNLKTNIVETYVWDKTVDSKLNNFLSYIIRLFSLYYDNSNYF